MRLETRSGNPSEMRGAFTLILYGGRHQDDLERVAFFDPDGDRFRLELYAAAFDFQVFPSLSQGDALQRAEAFVSRHSAFSYSYLSKIMGPQDQIIGFELVPVYRAFTTGVSNPLDITYHLEGDRVITRVRLQPSADPFRSAG